MEPKHIRRISTRLTINRDRMGKQWLIEEDIVSEFCRYRATEVSGEES